MNRIPPLNVNDGSNDPPKLRVYANGWGLLELPKLPHEKSWTADERLDKIAGAGFSGLQADVKYLDGLRKRGLRFCTSARVSTLPEVEPTIRKASADAAECVTLHVGWGMETDDEMDALVEAVLEASDRHKLPAYIETHRATITQDLWRTCRLIERIPEIRFNLDLSHFYCGMEMTYQGFDVAFERLEPVLGRTGFFHGRISNGESMQIDVGDGAGDNPHVANFTRAWTSAMGQWLEGAGKGDVLIFAPELGPPSSGYSITRRDENGTVVELSDRWQQSLVLKRLAEQCFAKARGNAEV